MLDQPGRLKVVAMQEGATYRVADALVIVKAVGAETNGSYALFEIHTAPGQGMPAQRQRYEDSAFWVLEGTYTFLLDTQERALEAGAYVYVPRGILHAVRNSGATPARLLVLVTPGGIHERFFAEVGERITDPRPHATPAGRPTLPQLVSVARKYGIEIQEAIT
jgi:quercetin dioxygenase-like cupin family protein